MDIRIAGIVNESVVDGPGIRMVIFTQGCPHNCPGCHNPETHDFDGGQLRQTGELVSQMASQRYMAGITISGGEPFCQPEAFAKLAASVRERGLSVTVFTGYTFEELTEMAQEDIHIARLMELTDILIDGRFVKALRDLTLQFRGSCNQRIIDMNRTREQGSVVLWQQ